MSAPAGTSTLWRRALVVLLLATAVAIAIIPVAWMIVTSFKSNLEITQETTILPRNPTLESYRRLFEDGNLALFLRNSLIVTAGSVAMALAIRSLAAGLGVVYTALNVSLVVWMMESFFHEIPVDIEEAAMVDGDSRIGALRRVVLPLAAPGLVATSIFAVIVTFNEFLFARDHERINGIGLDHVDGNEQVGELFAEANGRAGETSLEQAWPYSCRRERTVPSLRLRLKPITRSLRRGCQPGSARERHGRTVVFGDAAANSRTGGGVPTAIDPVVSTTAAATATAARARIGPSRYSYTARAMPVPTVPRASSRTSVPLRGGTTAPSSPRARALSGRREEPRA